MRKLVATAALLLAMLPAAVTNATPAEEPGRIAIGTFISDSYRYPTLYDRWSREVEHRPAILASYKSWTLPLIDTTQLEDVWQRGAAPIVTWEPWAEEGGRVFRLRDIAAGLYDDYIHSSARAAAAWERPLFVRFAHEMNGGWYPWGRGQNGNDPRVYKDAWRHIVRIFEAEGADNVSWVWCPNENSSGRFAFRQYYPGDRWVDWVGLDGFNWEVSPHWQTFTEVFAASYNSLVEMSQRPVMIVETGSWEQGGNKAEWVTDALTRELPRFEHVRAFLWWSVDDPRGDLRVESSPAALRAVREGLELPIYSATRSDLLRTPALLEPTRAVPVPGDDEPVANRVKEGLEENHLLIGLAVLAVCLLALGAVLIRQRGAAARGRGRRPESSQSPR